MGSDGTAIAAVFGVVAIAGVFGFMYFRKGGGSNIGDEVATVPTGPTGLLNSTGGFGGGYSITNISVDGFDVPGRSWLRRWRWEPWLTHLGYWGLSRSDYRDFVDWIEDKDRDDDDIERWIKKRIKKRRRDFRDRDWDDYYRGRFKWSRYESRKYRDRDGREYNKRRGVHDYQPNEWRDNDRNWRDNDNNNRFFSVADSFNRDRNRNERNQESDKWRRFQA